jgi:hypothetical protein
MKFFHSKISSRGGRNRKGIIVPTSKQKEWNIGETVRIISIDDIKMEVDEK